MATARPNAHPLCCKAAMQCIGLQCGREWTRPHAGGTACSNLHMLGWCGEFDGWVAMGRRQVGLAPKQN